MLYPELEEVGGLRNALAAEFGRLDSGLKDVSDSSSDIMPFTYSRVEKANKFSQVYLAAQEKLYLPDFWREGVCLAHGKTSSLTELAKAVDFWLCKDVTTAELASAFPFIEPNEKAAAFDENREVEYTWTQIQSDDSKKELKTFVDLAIKDEVLGKLFPFTSLYTLCFSRCTGYPYTYDAPTVTPVSKTLFGRSKYEVRLPDNEVIGRGNAAEAIALVKANLPLDIKRAVKGTAEDL